MTTIAGHGRRKLMPTGPFKMRAAAHDAVQTAHDVQRAVEADVVRGIDRADALATPAPVARSGEFDRSQDSVAHQEKRLGEAVKEEASDAAAAEAKLLTEKFLRTK